jgi:hypothetical protein
MLLGKMDYRLVGRLASYRVADLGYVKAVLMVSVTAVGRVD